MLWPQLDLAVAGVGGTETVLAADRGSYSLLGSVGISSFPLAEGSQTGSGAPARVTAVLAHARDWAYEPALSSGYGGSRLGLALRAYQAPQPTTGQLHALRCLETHGQFTQTDLSTIKTDLLGDPNTGKVGEFEAVSLLDNVISSLQTALTSSGSTALATAGQEAATIAQAVAQANRSTNGFTTEVALDLLGNVLNLTGAGAIVDLADATKDALNALAASVLIGEDVAYTATGDPALGSFIVNVSDFKDTLVSRYEAAEAGLQHVLDLIATDPGKLAAFWKNSASYTYVPSNQLNTAVQLAAAQFSWQSLLPDAYELVGLSRSDALNSGITDARQYVCTFMVGRFPSPPYKPFPSAPLSGQLLNSKLYVLVQNGADLPSGDDLSAVKPSTPAGKLTDPLFETYKADNGLISLGVQGRRWTDRPRSPLAHCASQRRTLTGRRGEGCAYALSVSADNGTSGPS